MIKLVDLLLGNFLQLINREYNFYIFYTIFYSKVCLTHVIIRLQDWRCLWCRACVHATCRANFIQNCSFGETRTATVPPTCLIKHQGIISFHFTISPVRWYLNLSFEVYYHHANIVSRNKHVACRRSASWIPTCSLCKL